MRDDLITDVSNYAEQAGCDVAVVFDGHGRDIAVGRVRVRFAGAESADTFIERLAHRSSADRPVTVDDIGFIATSFPTFVPMMTGLGAGFAPA